ncbi:unnamed protein product [Cercopithifilaria johnstoni]|uniref:Uncharacterized protein n=1 Tax=Cercopithifilaria johnstoni TaxID=2874296 RepID=A0A8J2QB35_9BILA|nr:unnamed protein product [Cercopithifilaria johnstoni]
MIHYFWNTDSTASDADTRITKTKGNNNILRMKDENIINLKQWPNTAKMVNAFTDIDLCENNLSTYGNDFSLIDSGIDSRSVSRANTNDTLSECTKESGMIHTSLRQRYKKWCDRKNDYEQREMRNGFCHETRELTRTRYNSYATSSRLPLYRSVRQDLSITRHVARVRSAHRKRSKSAAAFVQLRKSESGMESYENNSTFYEDYNQFY